MLSNSKVLFSYNKSIYKLDLSNYHIYKELSFVSGMNNPLSIVNIDKIIGFRNSIIFGEYYGNPDRKPISIYQRDNKTSQWKKVYEFPAGAIKHIHNIIPDTYRNCVYILTGDSDSESGIWVSYNNFNKVEPLLIGSQKYRSCCAFAIPEGLLYATDDPSADNYIYLLDLTNKQLHMITPIDGSCIYGAKYNNQFFFSTAVEPDSNILGFRYLLTSKLGKGVKDNKTHIYSGNIHFGFKEILSFDKDIWPAGLCQFGSVKFYIENDHNIYLYPSAVKKFDGELLKFNYK